MPDSRRPRRSRRYDDYSDSDDDYSSDDAPRRSHRERDDRQRQPQRHRSTRDGRNDRSYENYDKRRPRSVDDRHHSSRNDRYHSRERDRDYGDRDYDRSRAPEDDSRTSQLKIQNAVNAGLKAGALEAFRLRKEPGPWVGAKGVRIATAVFGAAMADTALEKNRDPERHRKTKSAKATLSGLVLNRFLNGPRDKVGRH